jgi:hypothetical protein
MTASRCLRRAATVAAAAALLALPTRAEAEPFLPPGGAGVAAGAAYVGITVGGSVTSIGALVTTVEDDATKLWSRSSLILGGVNGAIAAAWFIAGAVVGGEDALGFYILGSVQGSISLVGLVSGAVAEMTLPPADEGIVGREREPTPATFSVGSRF